MIQRFSLGFGDWNAAISIRVEKNKENSQLGIGNRCADGTYVLFIDYDHNIVEYIEEEILLLQKYRYIGDAFLFKTNKGYHVISLRKMSITEIVNALDMTTCDKNYQYIPMKYARRIWVLRTTNKATKEDIIFARFYPGELSEFEQKSNAHREYLRQRFKIPTKHLDHDGKNYDKNTALTMAHYYIN